jgi:hypothetical protein
MNKIKFVALTALISMISYTIATGPEGGGYLEGIGYREQAL